MQPFSGIKVLDFTHVLAGPFCTYQLAVMGAEVIKVEAPGQPDMMRTEGASHTLGEQGRGSHFLAQGANKKSIQVDFCTPQGRDILRKLVIDTDVLVENFRCGVMDSNELGYASLKEINPRLIYCSMTGFGHTGPKAQHPAYDNVIQAFSGLMAHTGDTTTAPVRVGPPVLDYGTGAQAAFSIAAALLQRHQSGVGQHIDVSMLDAALMLMSTSVMDTQVTGAAPVPPGNASLTHAGYGCFDTPDGQIMIGAYTARQHAALWHAVGCPELADEVEQLDSFALRERFQRDREILSGRLKALTAREWEDVLNEAGVPAARVRSLDETLTHPQVKARGVLGKVRGFSTDDAALQPPVAAFQYKHDGPAVDVHAAPAGFHTDEVLSNSGYTRAQLDEFRDAGIIS